MQPHVFLSPQGVLLLHRISVEVLPMLIVARSPPYRFLLYQGCQLKGTLWLGTPRCVQSAH